jgi:flagella synthesis protein FlgN
MPAGKILARKQSLIILLEQHGRKRSEILASLGLPPTARPGAPASPRWRQLLAKAMCSPPARPVPGGQRANGQSIQIQQALRPTS